ncbi:monovalent cation/H(+) antiporter subunit G [Salimicrobium flavidum]|uniref:Multisubunit sodium/proton antiporter, MrpG subunit n=1 Tax=Salimicrobium flavidum TaxID=570947 RepID=A0A1N7IID5_9BACI|nr:monovalent cation/H(+) antiporter subunit G [Salimicrobium flavidum]SIS36741.1 multisubunit sodium/proton antiporter, MrpG subunit [Salimicrobium flavidum]
MSGTWINLFLDILIIFFLLSGTFFVLSGSIGVVRFKNVYLRLHAATKSSTLGVAGLMLGAFLFMINEHGIVSGKLLLGIIFVLITAPVSAHMIGRAAYKSGVPLSPEAVRDDYSKTFKD